MDDFERLKAIAAACGWPEVEPGLSWGTPALLARKKMLVRIREEGILVLLCPMEIKAHLMQDEPEIFFQTDHYAGYPAVLVRMAAIDDDYLGDLIEQAWRGMATKKALAAFDAARASE